MLPEGKKSLRQIANVLDPADRVRDFVTLLEYILVEGYPSRATDFRELLRTHEDKFTDYRSVQFAREVRNKLGHAKGRATVAQIVRAEIDLNQAVHEILARRDFPDALRRDAEGTIPQQPPPTGFGKRPEPPSGKPHSPDATTNPKVNDQPVPEPRFAPPKTEENSVRQLKSNGSVVAVLGVFALAVVFVYWLASAHSSSQHIDSTPSGSIQPVAGIAVPPSRSPSQSLPSSDQSSGLGHNAQAPRADQFETLINTGLALSDSVPNIALLIEEEPNQTSTSVAETVLNSLENDRRFHFLGNVAQVDRLRKGGFFNDLYAGNATMLRQIIERSRIDYLLIAKMSDSCHHQTEIDSELISCTVTLVCKLADRSATIVNSADIPSVGPGFSEQQALQRAAENTAQEITHRILDSIRGK